MNEVPEPKVSVHVRMSASEWADLEAARVAARDRNVAGYMRRLGLAEARESNAPPRAPDHTLA